MTDNSTPPSGDRPARHCVVYAHPRRDSFCGKILETYTEQVEAVGQAVLVRDLYQLAFNPVLGDVERPGPNVAIARDVEAELDILARSEALVLIYPIWFGLPPAILKGYVDRVLGANYSYHDFRAQTGQPVLAHKPLVSFSTSGHPWSWLDEQGQVLSLREIFDVYLWRGFGMRQSEHVMIDSVVPNMSKAYIDEQLARVRDTAKRTCGMLEDVLIG